MTPVSKEVGRQPGKVLVVGAGVAGLAAAFELMNAGHDVTVFEASMLPGGRIRTLRQPFADGLYADMGAAFFADSDPYVTEYARRFDLPLMVDAVRDDNLNYFLGQRWIVTQQGVPLSIDGLTEEENKGGAAFIVGQYLIKGLLEKPVHPLDESWPPDELRQYDDMTALKFLQRRGASPAAIRFLECGVLGANGEGIDSYSALSLLAIVSLSLLARNSFWIIGGTELLPKAIAARLGHRVLYGTTVFHAASTQAGVELMVRSSDGQLRRHHADYAVIAVPLSSLKRMEFTPGLSDEKQRIVDELKRVSVTRTFLQMRERFWENEVKDGIVLSDQPPAVVIAACPLHHTRRGILEIYRTGEKAREIARRAQEQQIQQALVDVTEIFPEAPAFFEGGFSFSWDHDASACGAAAFFQPGQLLKSLPYMARPEGNCHFAGDETTALPGWSQAALFSGRRAATEISVRLARGNEATSG